MSVKIDELFYELELRTQGFEESLKHSESSAKRFTDFMAKNPILVAGAVGAALVAVGVKAVHMAEEFEVAAKRINATLPGMAGNVEELKKEITDLAIKTGISAQALSEAALEIGRAGVKDQGELISRLKTIQLLADATGGSMTELAHGMDSVLDEFGLANDQFEETAAHLFTIARGKTTVEELTGALHFAAPVIHDLGLEFDDAANAIAYLTDQGYKARQAGAELKKLGELGQEGADRIKALAAAGREVRDSLGEMKEAAKSAAENLDRQSGQIRESFNATMRDLGDVLIPAVTAGLNTLLNLLQTKGQSARRFDSNIEELNALGEKAKTATVTFDDLKGVMSKVADFRILAGGQGKLADQFKELDPDKLNQFAANLAVIRQRFIDVNVAERGGGSPDLVTRGRAASLQLLIDQLRAREEELRAQQVAAAIANAGNKPNTPEVDPNNTADAIKKRQDAEKALAELQKKRTEDARKEAADAQALADKAQSAFDRVTSSVASLQSSLFESLTLEYNKMADAIAQAVLDGQQVPDAVWAGLVKLKANIDSVRLFENLTDQGTQLEEQFKRLSEANFGQGDTSAITDMLPDVEALVAAIEAGLEPMDKETKLYKEQKAYLERILRLRNQILGVITDTANAPEGHDSAKEWKEKLDHMRATAGAIKDAAIGAIQLAEAFGGMTEETAKTLTNLVQLGTAIPQIVEMIQALSVGTKVAAGDLIGAALSALGALASLFSSKPDPPDPEEQRRAELLKKNNEVIADLTRHVGELGAVLASTSGTIIGGVTAATRNVVDSRAGLGVFGGPGATVQLAAELKKLGLSMADLREVAKGLGIEFANTNPTLAEMKKLLEALNAAQLTQFATDYTGKLQALRLEFELFDITDPIGQLKKLQQIVTDTKTGAGQKGGVFAGFGQFDLNTQAGRDAAEKYLQTIFEALKKGTLTPEQLGGLSPQELLDALKELEGLIDQANQTSAPQGETQGFNVSRTITEAQGSVVISQLGTIAYWQEALYKLLSGTVSGNLQPPSIIPSVPTGTSGGAVPIDVTVYLSITGILDSQTAIDTGAKVVDGMVSKLDAAYGARLRTRKLLTGDVVRS